MDNSDFIIRYTGAFSKEDCGEIIKYIEHFEGNNLLTYDETRLDIEDHRVISINNDFNVDLPAASIISRLILPRFKPCVDDYVKRYSLSLIHI